MATESDIWWDTGINKHTYTSELHLPKAKEREIWNETDSEEEKEGLLAPQAARMILTVYSNILLPKEAR